MCEMAALENITVSFCEPNGDGVMSYDINGTILASIINVRGYRVYFEADGLYRLVSERMFMF